MRNRYLASGALAGTLLWLAPVPVATQAQGRRAGSASAAAVAKDWAPSRTPDGQPDIQGIWLNYDSTPFEAPLPAPSRGAGGPVVAPSVDFDDTAPTRSERRRSMVIDPPSGRVPVMAWAEEKRAADLKRLQDTWESHGPWERCITRGVPGGIFPAGYGNGYQIIQAPGIVVINYEMIHEARIIPIDGRPHLPSQVRLWNGDSRGRWEGNTLVVEVTNYHGRGALTTSGATGRIKGIPASEALHVVERFTIVDPTTINYEVTITDPKVYTAPWKVAMPLSRDDSHEMFEYACHEGNYAMPNTLSAGRAAEKAAQGATK